MELNNHDAHCIDWYRRLVADGTAEDGQRIAVALYDENATLIAEVERLTKIVNAYAQSARTIALCLDEFCNRSLPYGEMIADAARKADQQIATLKKALEKYQKVEQWLDDMSNPLEPLKVSAALQSEIMKYNYRKEHKPESISELDGTIISALLFIQQAQEQEGKGNAK